MSDPYSPSYYTIKGIGESAEERLKHFQDQLDRFHLFSAPKKCPKHLRGIFMVKAKASLLQAAEFYKSRISSENKAAQ